MEIKQEIPPLKIRDVIKSMLIDSNQSATLPVASLIFDEDSVLYHDENEELI